jgi:hypothetical protein
MRELALPVHPDLSIIFGYSGSMQSVLFYFDYNEDRLRWDDGDSSGSGNTWAWLLWRGHPSVKPMFDGGPIILDRLNLKLYLPTREEVRQALRDPLPVDEPKQPESNAWAKAQQLMADFVVWLGQSQPIQSR